MRFKLFAIALLGFSAGILLYFALNTPFLRFGNPETRQGKTLLGGAFSLTDHTGKRVTDQDFKGKFILIYFGFTHCPDICPGDLQVMAAALDKLGPKADQIAPIFVTIDPERDTVDVLNKFIPFFHKRIVGLTGTPQEIEQIARAYRIYYTKVPQPNSSLGYLMSHSAYMYLMDKDGRYLNHFNHGTPPEKVVETISKYL